MPLQLSPLSTLISLGYVQSNRWTPERLSDAEIVCSIEFQDVDMISIEDGNDGIHVDVPLNHKFDFDSTYASQSCSLVGFSPK
jgi:hypothetical protein